MARFLFCAVGASGHVNPMLPVTAELVRRGHEVAFGTSAHMERTVAPRVTRFHAVGPDVGPDSTDRPEWAQFADLRGSRRVAFAVRKVLFPLAETSSKELLDIVASFKPDVLVFDFMTFAGNIVAEVTGLPWATGTPVPGMLQGRDAHPFGLALPYSKNRLVRLALRPFWPLANITTSLQYDGQFNAVRTRFGLPRIRNAFFTANVSPYLVLAFAPHEVEYPRRAWPPAVHFVGPGLTRPARPAETPPWLEALPSSRPLIYATVGTSPTRRHVKYLETLRAAVEGLEADVVASVGTGLQPPASSGNLRIESWVPHPAILPKARMVIHHGGSNTMYETLAYGKPALATPFEDGQDENAARLRWAGAGTVVNPDKVSVAGLRAAIDGVLGSEAMRERAEALAESLLKYDSGRIGADLLERLAQTRAPVPREH